MPLVRESPGGPVLQRVYARVHLFWGALVFSLSVGFAFAFPVNAALVHVGVKEGMKNPTKMGQGQRGGQAQAAD